MWHAVQARPACALVSGKADVCGKVAPFQVVVLWHWLQVVEKAPVVWRGFVVAWKSGMWQLEHAVDRPV